MYREMLKQGMDIYCDKWPCDRECGKFHKPFLNTTKLRRMETLSEAADQGPSTSKKEEAKGIFEEIMEAAARKDSQNFIPPSLPPLPAEFQSMTLGHEVKRQSTKGADTTMIHFDNPVWDDAKFRQQLLDSDDENFSLAAAPYIMADEDTLDDILRDTQHESGSNPIQHFQSDETILSSDDEHGNLSNERRGEGRGSSSTQNLLGRPKTKKPEVKYEKSILDL
ncbi:hypothetical protein CAEBREN_10720 [Caenorhabditis brenneri]|uniref:Uncharacterized protein n=1 Tax=Caenorhabditis brenneri TaxID=135651 RepID=G0MI26_CAEBE|nr:hypothetical protein CAEBREN_10720 [Caenorhabditis brenneri]